MKEKEITRDRKNLIQIIGLYLIFMTNYNQNNQFALKYKTSKSRNILHKKYCRHLSRGLSKESFVDCNYKTIESYMNKYPNDFPADDIDKAERAGRLVWEKMGLSGTKGEIKNFNTRCWTFNMKNRYGWKDRDEAKIDDDIAYPRSYENENDIIFFNPKTGAKVVIPQIKNKKGDLAIRED